MSILEGMIFGLPSIAFENEGPNEIIQDNCGIIIPKYNTDIFADKICDILNHQKQWEIMSQNAVVNAKRFNRDVIEKQIISIISKNRGT